MAYLRTIPLSQLEGPSGLIHLREDLNERARMRSEGHVEETGDRNAGGAMTPRKLVGGLAPLPASSSPCLRSPSRRRACRSSNEAGGGAASGRMVQMIALLTVLSLAPGLLIMVTASPASVIALSFLRSGLGLQSTPANLVLISLSLFMTFYVMGPTFDRAWKDGIQPADRQRDFRAGGADARRRLRSASSCSRRSGRRISRPSPILPPPMGQAATSTAPEIVELRILIPAFMISELRAASKSAS